MTAESLKVAAVDYIRHEYAESTPVAQEPYGSYVVVSGRREREGNLPCWIEGERIMKKNQIARIVRQLTEAADAIAELDSDLIHALIDNDCAVPMPQELRELADRLATLPDRRYASRIVAIDDNPGKTVYTLTGYGSFVA